MLHTASLNTYTKNNKKPLVIKITRKKKAMFNNPFWTVTEMQTASTITLMMEAVRTSETSVYFSDTTLRCLPERGRHYT
jgi:hypothetical protein